MELITNYSAESRYYLSDLEFLLCWDNKFYHTNSDVGSIQQISEYPTVRQGQCTGGANRRLRQRS